MQGHSTALAWNWCRVVVIFAILLLASLTGGCGRTPTCGAPPSMVSPAPIAQADSAVRVAPVAAAVQPTRLAPNERYRVNVIRVLDGDTFSVRWYEEEAKVRVLGIDTPERGEPGFGEATDYLRNRIDGRSVELFFPKAKIKRDGFGRLLAEVWLDGEDIGEAMLKGGYAKVYRDK